MVMFDLSAASFVGPAITDADIPSMLPLDYREFLLVVNGCVLFDGGLHIRGACADPDWHSLRRAWIGKGSLATLYPAIENDDVPFAQDCFGDQFLLRAGRVLRLDGETGDIFDMQMGWQAFFLAAQANPTEFLSLQLLTQYLRGGEAIHPGELLSVFPPLCTSESADGVSLKAIPTWDRIGFLADFAAQITNVPEGAKIRMRVT